MSIGEGLVPELLDWYDQVSVEQSGRTAVCAVCARPYELTLLSRIWDGRNPRWSDLVPLCLRCAATVNALLAQRSGLGEPDERMPRALAVDAAVAAARQRTPEG